MKTIYPTKNRVSVVIIIIIINEADIVVTVMNKITELTAKQRNEVAEALPGNVSVEPLSVNCHDYSGLF